MREYTKMMNPTTDFDGIHTFYNDETNNIKKFYVRENNFNNSFTTNFVLGGLVHTGTVAPDLQPLIDGLKLQKTVTEVKFKHIAHGEFLDCLKSEKLNYFLDYIFKSDLYVHYTSLNILYWSIVDIVDSAIASSEAAMQAGITFANHLKNDLYKLCRLEIESVIELFYLNEYPNIKEENLPSFIEDLTSLFDEYIDTDEFHFGLESLRQILKEAKKEASLPFVMDEEEYVLLKDFSQFYLRSLYLFKNSHHIFDKEEAISDIVNGYKIFDGKDEIKNHSFVDSKSNQIIQCSDVFIGLMGKFTSYLNTSLPEKVVADLEFLNAMQLANVILLIRVIDKSFDKNVGCIHSIDAFAEMSKINIIRGFVKLS